MKRMIGSQIIIMGGAAPGIYQTWKLNYDLRIMRLCKAVEDTEQMDEDT